MPMSWETRTIQNKHSTRSANLTTLQKESSHSWWEMQGLEAFVCNATILLRSKVFEQHIREGTILQDHIKILKHIMDSSR